VKGLLSHDLKRHIVIFGNRGAETAALIKKLAEDPETGARHIVLCSQTTQENPFPDLIRFVHGELTSEDVMERASVKDAAKILIHGGSDAETAFVALAVKDVNQTAHIVVNVSDPGQEINLQRIDKERIICIKPVNVPMMVREIHNPGITQVLECLLASEGQDLRSLEIPAVEQPLKFGVLAHIFRERHGAILIGMRPSGNALSSGAILNPPFEAKVEGGMYLDYISPRPVSVSWAEVAAEHRAWKS
jgi:Trk K+ transport system NAD-binding subunit